MPMLSEVITNAPFLRKGEPQFMANLVRRLPANSKILEIGTFRGLSAVVMAQARTDVEIITIDPHIGMPEIPQLYSNPFIVETNLKKYNVSDRVFHKAIPSKDYFPKEEFDLLFIDGDQSFEGVCHDYYKFEPYVKKGGFILFHDYGTHDGVTKFCVNLIPYKVGQFATLFLTQKK